MEHSFQLHGRALNLSDVSEKGDEIFTELTGDADIVKNAASILLALELTNEIDRILKPEGYIVRLITVPDTDIAKAVIKLRSIKRN